MAQALNLNFTPKAPRLIESAGWWNGVNYWTETVLFYSDYQQVNVRYRVNGLLFNEAWFPAAVFGWEGK
jgi:hypothetical protein